MNDNKGLMEELECQLREIEEKMNSQKPGVPWETWVFAILFVLVPLVPVFHAAVVRYSQK